MHSPIITIMHVNFVMHGMKNVKLCKFLSCAQFKMDTEFLNHNTLDCNQTCTLGTVWLLYYNCWKTPSTNGI